MILRPLEDRRFYLLTYTRNSSAGVHASVGEHARLSLVRILKHMQKYIIKTQVQYDENWKSRAAPPQFFSYFVPRSESI